MGLEKITNAHLRDFVDVMRKLWRGERVSYEGPLGKMPYLHMADWINDDIPLMFVGFGEKSLAFAGSIFDGVVLHTYISDEALARSVKIVRDAAERAGRDPQAVKIWSVLAVAHEPDEEKYLRYIVGRMATYLQAPNYGDLLVSLNGWDMSVLERFRADDVVRSMPGSIDSVATLDQLKHMRTLIPEHWLPAAVGSAQQCAQRFNDQFAAGADGVILHASRPKEFAPVLEAYQQIRDHARFAGRSNRPC
jgi:probable F420-dependent oxidoreductase